jgi:phage FluMu protein Com
MPIELNCPSCSHLLRVPDHVAGKQVRCPHCQTVSTVPQAAELVDAIPVEVAPAPAANPFATAPAPPYPRQNLGDDAAVRMLLPVGRSGWAIAAGYFGLFSVLFCPAPIAVILGVIAIIHIRKNPKLHGMGRAIFGLVMGLIFSGILALAMISSFFG